MEDMGYIHHFMIWCDARGDSKLANRLSGFTFNSVTTVCSNPGLGACALTHLTAGAQTLKHHKPEVRSDKRVNLRAVKLLPLLKPCLSTCGVIKPSSCNTPSTFTEYVLKHFILHQKRYSTTCLQLNFSLFCFASAVKEKIKTLYQGLYPKLLRFLFRGYEREPWQTAFLSMRSVGKAFQADCQLPGSID